MFSKWRVRNNTIIVLAIMYVIAFADRANFSVAAPFIQEELKLTSGQMGIAMSAFIIGYGWFQVLGGIFADRYGAKKGMTFGLIWWSIFTALTGLASGFASLVAIRFFFGVGEAFQPPAAFKTVSMWFPKREQVRANALSLCTTALAPAITPMLVIWCIQALGWKGIFYAFSIPGFIMAWVTWKVIYDDPAKHPKMTKEELEEIYDGKPPASQAPKMTLWEACRVPGLVPLALTFLIFDITYWGFFSWLPSYLVKARGFGMLKLGISASLPFLSGFVGLLLADKIGTVIFKGNKILFLRTIWLIGAASMYVAFNAESPEVCVAALSLTAFSAIYMNMGPFWGLMTELMPAQSMGFLSSIINGAGKIGGALSPILIGYLIDWTNGSYAAGFALMEVSLIACVFIVALVPKEKVAAVSNLEIGAKSPTTR